jgi:hypothetical protein
MEQDLAIVFGWSWQGSSILLSWRPNAVVGLLEWPWWRSEAGLALKGVWSSATNKVWMALGLAKHWQILIYQTF